MSFVQVQVMSDLHLETPFPRPMYETFRIKPKSRYLALLGDIGYVSDQRLFKFLEKQLRNFQAVFFLLGNHEPYGIAFQSAKALMKSFADKMDALHCTSTVGRFVLLDQTRYDVIGKVSILGCTLFSRVPMEQQTNVGRLVTDFHEIQNWTVEDHNRGHLSDLAWLNAEVAKIQLEEPDREIMIFTHHSPTVLDEANDPTHKADPSGVGSAFATDLSTELCWTSPLVKLWAWGHTHYNCDFRDPQTGKRAVANQGGFGNAKIFDFDEGKVVGTQDYLSPSKKP